MNPVEVMTSESQERMLAIVRPTDLDEVLALCARWEIRATVVGSVTDTGRFRVYDGVFDARGIPGANPVPPVGEDAAAVSSDRVPIADVPVGSLGDGPSYDRPARRPDAQDALVAADPAPLLAARFPAGTDVSGELLSLLARPTVADKSWISRQYDHQLFLNTVVGPGGDAAVLRLPDTRRALALSTDGKARFAALDPRTGARLVVLEAVRNVVTSGARPIALVNCLNFGNPEHAAVMWQFAEVVDGMSEACRAFDLPVIGGNVSFYNESRGADIDPTPVVGVIGLIDELDAVPPGIALRDGDAIVLLGETAVELGGSEWATMHDHRGGVPPRADLERAAALHGFVRSIVTDRTVAGVHDCSDGGVAVTLAEMAFAGAVGFDVEIGDASACFSESASRVVCSVDPARVEALLVSARAGSVPAAVIGTAGGTRLRAAASFDVALEAAERAWRDAIPSALGAVRGVDV